MIRIGVTGGIGSGKSVVCEILKLHNIPTYDADFEAKHLNDNSSLVREQIIKHFGRKLYENNKLNRQKFAEIIFADKDKLTLANSIIHPELAKHFEEWVLSYKNHPIVAMDAAVLFEAGFQKFVDFSIIVTAPLSLRIERTMKRDNALKAQVEDRIKSQMADKEKIELADFVIENNNSQSLLKQTENILRAIRKQP